MKKVKVLFTALFLLAFLGCDGLSNTELQTDTGNINFAMNFTTMSTERSMKKSADSIEISGVKITLSRNAFDDIVEDLTVTNNIAEGKVTGLEKGYWHVSASVYDNTNSKVFTGEQDIKIIPGGEIQCTILFDPTDGTVVINTTGDVSFLVGLNPYPGYTLIDQNMSKILFDQTGGFFYILDNSRLVINKFNADNLNLVDDYSIEDAPADIALSPNGDGFLLGYPTGKLFLYKFSNRKMTKQAEIVDSILNIFSVNSDLLIAVCKDSTFKLIDMATGQVLSTKSSHYNFASYAYNPITTTLYSYTSGVSPSDIHHTKIDIDSKTILFSDDSIYHGDHSFGSPLGIFNAGTKLIAGSGNIFNLSNIKNEDIIYAGNIGESLGAVFGDEQNNHLYTIGKSETQKKLMIWDYENLFLKLTLDIPGDVSSSYRSLGYSKLYATASNIIVFTKADEKYYSKVFTKEELGL